MTKLVAELWCCDDELDGLCYEPRIDRTRPHPVTKGFVLREEVWRGTFVNEPEPAEYEAIKQELRDAAARYGIPLTEEEGWTPFGVLDESS